MKDAITNFKSELNMMDEKCYAMPKYTSESPEVQKACDAMNNYLKASITYKMTNQDVVVNKDLISGWVTYDEDMNATLDESKVKKSGFVNSERLMIRLERQEVLQLREENRRCQEVLTAGQLTRQQN